MSGVVRLPVTGSSDWPKKRIIGAIIVCALLGAGCGEKGQAADLAVEASAFEATEELPDNGDRNLVGVKVGDGTKTRLGITRDEALAIVEGDYTAPLRWGESRTGPVATTVQVNVRASGPPLFYDSMDEAIGHGLLQPSWFSIPVEVTLSGLGDAAERFNATALMTSRRAFWLQVESPLNAGSTGLVGEALAHAPAGHSRALLTLAVAGGSLSGMLLAEAAQSGPFAGLAVIGHGRCDEDMDETYSEPLTWGIPIPLGEAVADDKLSEFPERLTLAAQPLMWSDGKRSSLTAQVESTSTHGCLGTELYANGQDGTEGVLSIPVRITARSADGRYDFAGDGSLNLQWDDRAEAPGIIAFAANSQAEVDSPADTSTALGFAAAELPEDIQSAASSIRLSSDNGDIGAHLELGYRSIGGGYSLLLSGGVEAAP